MAWISIHEGITTHPKTRKLMRHLKCSRHEAVGILVFLWQWCLVNADRDGVLLDVYPEDIANEIMFRPTPDLSAWLLTNNPKSDDGYELNEAEYFVHALVESGWIDVDELGRYVVHDWDEWQSSWYKYLDEKEVDKNRKRNARAKTLAESTDKSECPPDIPPDIPPDNPVDNPEKIHGHSTGISDGIPTLTRPDNTRPDQTISLPHQEILGSLTTSSSSQSANADSDDVDDDAPPDNSVPYQKIMTLYNRICTRLPKIRGIEGERRKHVSSRYKKYGMDTLVEVFKKANANDFMCGGGGNGWTADFDWLMNPTNIVKVLEDKYDKRSVSDGINARGHPSHRNQAFEMLKEMGEFP